MPVRNLDKIFRPKRVAVVGASDQPSKVGHTVLRNLISAGFSGAVYPVNPKCTTVQGIKAYPNVACLPDPPDLAVVCIPAPGVPRIIQQCGEAGIMGVIVLSAGFREFGAEGRALENQVRANAARFDGLRVLGPNCLGAIVPSLGLNASFAAAMPKPGHIAFVSQSGALCTSVLDWALEEEIGFSYFVSIGNMLDVGVADLVDYFGADPHTKSIVLYVESIDEARRFMSAARAFARGKPIVAYKAGRFQDSARAAASHTGAMAGVDAVYEAAFQRAGIVRVYEMDDLFDCAELLARKRMAKGPRLGILTNAGGPGVMATDALMARSGVLASLAEPTIEALNRILPAYWSHGNPVDVLGDAPPDRFGLALGTVLADRGVDAALVILTPQAMTDPTGAAAAVAALAARSSKPVLAAWMGGRAVEEGTRLLTRSGVPTYPTPEHAVRAFMYLVSYTRNLEVLHETPRELPLAFAVDRQRTRKRFEPLLASPGILSQEDSKELLEAYGIPTTKPQRAATAAEAVEAAGRIGFPVAMKIASPDITHKTDVDGVVLNVANESNARDAFERIVSSAAKLRPDARIEGVTVERMIAAPQGIELIIGARQDPVFGPVLMAGLGGVTAEILGDSALGLPPLNERLARRMLESLRSWPLLQGYRGKAPIDLDRLIEVLIRLSYLVADYPEIQELDVNPLVATPTEVLGLDARVVVGPGRAAHPERPYSHLAIHPYPDQFVRTTNLADGTPVRLRPIKPEDEPLWHALLAGCSTESIWFRFRYLFRETTHQMATRFCFIDYDRELAIVAEVEEEGRRKLAGVGRLVADADHRDADYAVLVGDRWQGRGLGSLLTDECLKIAQQWGLALVVAETSPMNTRMLAILANRGFEIDTSLAPDVVLARKHLPVP